MNQNPGSYSTSHQSHLSQHRTISNTQRSQHDYSDDTVMTNMSYNAAPPKRLSHSRPRMYSQPRESFHSPTNPPRRSTNRYNSHQSQSRYDRDSPNPNDLSHTRTRPQAQPDAILDEPSFSYSNS